MMRLYPDEEEVSCHLLYSTHTCSVGLLEQRADHLLYGSVMHWSKRATRLTSQVQSSWTWPCLILGNMHQRKMMRTRYTCNKQQVIHC